MIKLLKLLFTVQFICLPIALSAHSESLSCQHYLSESKQNLNSEASNSSIWTWVLAQFKNKVLKNISLKYMAYSKGLPKYLKRIQHLKESGQYLNYHNFGEMGLAEIGFSVRYNRAFFESLNTGRPLIIIGNHHLGIADGLTMQHLSSQARFNSPSLLLLARWIEKLLPHAVFGDDHGWGTAVPVDINTPKPSDPLFESKMAEINKFNSSWSKKSFRVLKDGGALIIFPAGHVASINKDGKTYPDSVYDAPNSWQEGFLSLARIAKADLVFTNIVSVNSQDFYEKRKRFGGGDLERVIWFFSEALAKKGQTIDVELSKPMSLDQVYDRLSEVYSYPKDTLISDQALTAELMRQYTYELSTHEPQVLDTVDSPQRK